MAQMTGAMTLANCKIYIGTTSAFPTGAFSLSDISNELAVSGGDLTIVKAFTFGTGTPIIAAGNKDSLTLTVKAQYSEVVADGYATLAGYYENKTAVYMQFIPKGTGTTGVYTFTTSIGYVKSHPYVSGNAEGSDFAGFELVGEFQSITRSTL